jgi:hypothetical protein
MARSNPQPMLESYQIIEDVVISIQEENDYQPFSGKYSRRIPSDLLREKHAGEYPKFALTVLYSR